MVMVCHATILLMTFSYTLLLSLFTPSSLTMISLCANAVIRWHIRSDQLLNPTKMETLGIGIRQQVMKPDQSGDIVVFWVNVLFILKLWMLAMDHHLSFDDHITYVVRVCNYYIMALHHIRPLINSKTANTIAYYMD